MTVSNIPYNLLAISVGNSRTRIGGFEEGKLVANHSFANDAAEPLSSEITRTFESLRHRDETSIVMATTNPPLSDELRKVLKGVLPHPIQRVEADLPIPIGRQLDPEAMIGEDRLLNAAAAYDVLQQACVVVDAGTAITVDLVDGAGTFHGGAIGPGAQLMLRSMYEHTAQLPDIEFTAPVEPIGHSTVEAMRSAVFYGLRGMVRELVEQFAEIIGTYPMVIATGGNSEILFRDYDLVDRVAPDLTLMGIGVTLKAALRREQDREE